MISDGAARGTGGAVNAGASNVVCGGSAWLRPTGGLGGTGGTNIPTITWDDGQVMDWATGPTSVGISAPIADGASARRVLAALKVDYATQSIATMDVRDAQTGQILYMVRGGQGVAPPAPTADDLTALFGVDATADVWCTYSIEFGCATERQTILNHLLHTTPEQVISSDPSQLTTPSGTFSALWFTASSEFTVDGGAEAGACDIGAPDAHVVSFIASRVAGT